MGHNQSLDVCGPGRVPFCEKCKYELDYRGKCFCDVYEENRRFRMRKYTHKCLFR